MRTQIRGLQQGLRNAQDGISLIQTAEGALNEVHALLQRMRELTVQSGSTHLSVADRTAIGEEILTLRNEIDNISIRARFNGLSLLTGALAISTTSTIADIADAGGDGASVTVDVANGQAGISYTIDSPGAGQIRMTNVTSGVAQTLTVASLGDNSTQVLDFSALGVRLLLNENAGAYVDGLTAADIVTDVAGKTIATTGSGAATFRVGAEVVDNITVMFNDTRAAALGDGGANDVADLVVDNQSVATVALANALLSRGHGDRPDLELPRASRRRAEPDGGGGQQHRVLGREPRSVGVADPRRRYRRRIVADGIEADHAAGRRRGAFAGEHGASGGAGAAVALRAAQEALPPTQPLLPLPRGDGVLTAGL